MSLKPEITVLIFDSYAESQQNIKAQTWESRHKAPIKYQLTTNTELKGLKLKDILSHPETKRTLTEILSYYFIKMMGDKMYITAYGFVIESNIVGWTHPKHSHFEADTLLVCVMNELMNLRKEPLVPVSSDCFFHLISPDTDVLTVAVNFLQSYLGQSRNLSDRYHVDNK